MNIIKKNKLYVGIFLGFLIAITYFLLESKEINLLMKESDIAKRTIPSGLVVDEESLGNLKKICYLKKNSKGVSGNGGLNNIEYIEVNYSESSIITGFLSYTYSDKDSAQGEFVGALNNGFINAIYTGNNGEKTWEEQILFKISNKGIIKADYIDKIENEEGVIVIEDINKITFNMTKPIAEIDCTLVNPEEVGL